LNKSWIINKLHILFYKYNIIKKICSYTNDKLNCDYIFISVPWCHYNSDKWFLKWHHRRYNEHLWHFNDKSLVRFFDENGYENLYLGNFEDAIRKNNSTQSNILSAIFKKKHN
jgi:hypothetical protein